MKKLFFVITFSCFVFALPAQYLTDFCQSFFEKQKDYEAFMAEVDKKAGIYHDKKGGKTIIDKQDEYVSELFIANQYKDYAKEMVSEKVGLMEPVYGFAFSKKGELSISPDWIATQNLYDKLSKVFKLVPFNVIQDYDKRFAVLRENHWDNLVSDMEVYYTDLIEAEIGPNANETNYKKLSNSANHPIVQHQKTGELHFHNSQFYDVVIKDLESRHGKVDYLVSPSIQLLRHVVSKDKTLNNVDSYHRIKKQIIEKYGLQDKYRKEYESTDSIKQKIEEYTSMWTEIFNPLDDQLEMFYRLINDQAHMQFFSVDVFKNLKHGKSSLSDLSLMSIKTFRQSEYYKEYVKKDENSEILKSPDNVLKAYGKAYTGSSYEMDDTFKASIVSYVDKDGKVIREEQSEIMKNARAEDVAKAAKIENYYFKINTISQDRSLVDDLFFHNIDFLFNSIKDLEIATIKKKK